jgi:hypothetical protein
MKKGATIAVLLLTAFLMQYCKKSSDDTTTTTTTTPVYTADINYVAWTPTSVSATLTYNSTAKTKTFSCVALGPTDEITFSILQPSVAGKVDSGFTVKAYSVDTVANNVLPKYFTLSNGVFTQIGTVKSGYINVTAIDSLNKVITGTFTFTQNKLNYDGNGKVTSITSTLITAGTITSMPYTFKKQ